MKEHRLGSKDLDAVLQDAYLLKTMRKTTNKKENNPNRNMSI